MTQVDVTKRGIGLKLLMFIVGVRGVPFEGHGEVRGCFERTEEDRFIGASSIERLPVERAVIGGVKEFKNLKMK